MAIPLPDSVVPPGILKCDIVLRLDGIWTMEYKQSGVGVIHPFHAGCNRELAINEAVMQGFQLIQIWHEEQGRKRRAISVIKTFPSKSHG